MIPILKIEDVSKSDILTRDIKYDESVIAVVKAVISDVQNRGDAALFEYTEKFDKAKLTDLKVSKKEMDEALQAVDKYFMKTLETAAKNIREYHEKQLENGYEIKRGDAVLGCKVTPVESAGLYVPGGTASYPSTVLMDAIPAKVAGVENLVMYTPPDANGKIAPAILAAAYFAGVDSIFKLGGAQAVAAMAYGTESVPSVCKIVGPGNIYVATAKRLVFGKVGIDMIAGPSEILIIADKTADPDFVAADLLSQAEHDILSSSILLTTSMDLAKSVQTQVEKQLLTLKRADIAKKSIDANGKIIVVPDIKTAVELSNEIAPEHLEIMTADPFAVFEGVKNAGSVFLGEYSPEPLGDYMSGTNHTLPTSGTAKFSSPLSVSDFMKKMSYTCYTKPELEKLGDMIIDFATREGLDAHAKAIEKRMKK